MEVYWREHRAGLALVLRSEQEGKEVVVGNIRRTPRGYDALAKSPGYDPERARRGFPNLEAAKAFVESFRPWELYPVGEGLQVDSQVRPLPGTSPAVEPSTPAPQEEKGKGRWPWQSWKQG